MDIEGYINHLIAIDSKYAKIVKQFKNNVKDVFKITSQYELKRFINKINQERINSGKAKIWGLVYRITNKDTSLQRIGETDSEINFLFIDRLINYLNTAKKMLEPKSKLNAFEIDLANYFEFNKGKNLKPPTKAFINEFFNGYEVEIWLCESKLEMHALEVLITLYSNRIDNEQGYDINRNKFFNPIIGNLRESLTIEEAYNLEKLEPILAMGFDQVLSKEQVYQNLLKAGIKISESTFDSYCIKLTGNTYYYARDEYMIRNAAINSELDSRLRSWKGKTFSNDKMDTLLWTILGPDGSINPLFLGFHLDDNSGNGFIHSFIKYHNKFQRWFISDINQNPDITCDLISDLIYKVIKNNDFSPLGNNWYKYKYFYNGKFIYFKIKCDNINGQIYEIMPI